MNTTQATSKDLLQAMIAEAAAGHAPDLHRLQQLQKSIEQEAALDFREIGDYVHDGLYIADGRGVTVYVNKAYCQMTGIAAHEVVNKSVSDLESQRLFINAVTPQVLKQKRQVSLIGQSMRNGTKMLITGNPIFDNDGQVKMVVANNRVITDLLKLQSELEASQAKIRSVEEDNAKSAQEIELLRRQQTGKSLIGRSEEIRKIVTQIYQVAQLDVTVLITGETGSGKEVVANELHLHGGRSGGPFIKVNCAAIPANLLEAELFGYEKGAFTGATATGKLGMFELADKGTLLLDEIGEMPLELQSKLLRVIQHKELTRIGGTKPTKLDVKILASTNVDLKALVKEGKFREDLYYRLNVFPIFLPPLRRRQRDIELLSQYFLEIYNTKYSKTIVLTPESLLLLEQYPWPGNIRELQNVLERLVIISEPACAIGAAQVSSLLNLDTGNNDLLNTQQGLKELVENLERKTILQALASSGSTRKAAKILKIDQSTIVKKAKKLGININDEKTHQS